uniref:ARID domain-containing protein n=1 Tax=Parastrongyloides trichosuri TaxID=131310 RepID=A0A0N5A2F6_PARTI
MGDGNEYIQSMEYMPMDGSRGSMHGVPDPYYNMNPMYQNTNVMYQQNMQTHLNYQQQNQNIPQMPQQVPPQMTSQGLQQPQSQPPTKGKKGRKKGSKNDVQQQNSQPQQQPSFGMQQHLQSINGPIQNGPISQWNGYNGPQQGQMQPPAQYRGPPQYLQQPVPSNQNQYANTGYPPQPSHGAFYGRGSQEMSQGYYQQQQAQMSNGGPPPGSIPNGQYPPQPTPSQYSYPPVEQGKMTGPPPPNPYYMNQNMAPPTQQAPYYGSQNMGQGPGMMIPPQQPSHHPGSQQQQSQTPVVRNMEYNNQQSMPHQIGDGPPGGHYQQPSVSQHQQDQSMVKNSLTILPQSSSQVQQQYHILQNKINEIEMEIQALTRVHQTPDVASKMNYLKTMLNSLISQQQQIPGGNGSSNCSTPITQHSPMLAQSSGQSMPIPNIGNNVLSQQQQQSMYPSPQQTYPQTTSSYPTMTSQQIPSGHINQLQMASQHQNPMMLQQHSQQNISENGMVLGQQPMGNIMVNPTTSQQQYPTPYTSMENQMNGNDYPMTTSNSSANSGGSKESIIPPEPTPSNYTNNLPPTSQMLQQNVKNQMMEYSDDSNNIPIDNEMSYQQQQQVIKEDEDEKILQDNNTMNEEIPSSYANYENDSLQGKKEEPKSPIPFEEISNVIPTEITIKVPSPLPPDLMKEDEISNNRDSTIMMEEDTLTQQETISNVPSIMNEGSQESFSQVGTNSQVTSIEEEENTCSSLIDTINEVAHTKPDKINNESNFCNEIELRNNDIINSIPKVNRKLSGNKSSRKNSNFMTNVGVSKVGRKNKRKKNDSDFEDDDDEYGTKKGKKMKKSKGTINYNNIDGGDSGMKDSYDMNEIPEDLIEKRRSGRRNAEKSYVDRMDFDEGDENDVIMNDDNNCANNDEIIDNNVKLTDVNIVEKILSIRMGKRIFNIDEDMGNSCDIKVSNDEDMGETNALTTKEDLNDIKDDNIKENIEKDDNNIGKDDNNSENMEVIENKQNVGNEEPKKDIVTEEREVEEYYVKFRGKSYAHSGWRTLEELEVDDKRVLAKINRYKQKLSEQPFLCTDDDIFNPDYLIPERVLDAQEKDGIMFYFIKWRQLAYDECTWEVKDLVNDAVIEEFEKRNTLDMIKVNPRKRPEFSEFKGIQKDKIYKDGNSLREYQHEGVSWLTYCYYFHRNCILADEMGLGKTVQSVTFLQELYNIGIHGPFLVIVPLSTLHNWEREFETWTDLNTIVYHGSTISRDITQRYEFYYSSTGKIKRNVVKFDAIITTFEMVVSDVNFLSAIPYRVAIIDEAHRLKNRNCRLITHGLGFFKIEHKVLLTGTPLQNNMQELFSLLNYLDPEQFNSAPDFLELQNILKPMMLRRLKEDVEKTLQPKEETIIEVQLSTIQKKYYRAILEKNFSHLCKSTSAPTLMNTMMELRKCCNHPFLISGAEEQILNDLKLEHPEMTPDELLNMGIIQSSGKLVLCSKLLPKLKKDGHRVLMFSQMTRTLDIIEEYLCLNGFKFERIDGNIRGDLRQAAIDRFSKEGSDRFIFLLCTKAGGVGINLTAADTCIIFDSDWNPQNDLQAQARCHRIGQKKMVKIYRLITANTYEREMFDRASMKLGLDKAVLQSMSTKENPNQLSKKDIEELLKKGAYGALMDDDTEGKKRTQTITHESVTQGSTFSKATFSSGITDDIDINDPNFWSKWAEKANINPEPEKEEEDLILMEPRNRRKRFDDAAYKKMNGGDHTDDDDTEGGKKDKGKDRSEKRKSRRRGNEDDEDGNGFVPDELAFNKANIFKVEKLLLIWGWGRWKSMKENSDLSFTEEDFLHAARTLLLHCVREYRSDEKVRDYVWKLIAPTEEGEKSSKKDGNAPETYNQGWAGAPEYNPPQIALDGIFQRHINRHTNKVIQRVYYLSIISNFILKGKQEEAADINKSYEEIDVTLPTITDPFIEYWDSDYDKCFLIGIYRHGMENYDAIKGDENLIFAKNPENEFPSSPELNARFKRLMICYQKYLEVQQQIDEHKKQKNLNGWTREERDDFLRVLNSYGLKDVPGSKDVIEWTRFKELSTHLKDKGVEELLSLLFAMYTLLTKIGGENVDVKRPPGMDFSQNKARIIITRVNLMRKIHQIADMKEEEIRENLKLLVNDYMPSGWSIDNDFQYLKIVENIGLDDILKYCKEAEEFKNVTLPTEKILLRRAFEIATTFEYGKYIPVTNLETYIDDESEDSKKSTALPTPVRGNTPTVSNKSRVKRKTHKSQSPVTVSASTSHTSTKLTESEMTTLEKEKMEALMLQASLQNADPQSLAMIQLLAQSGALGSNVPFSFDNMSMEQVQQLQQLIVLSLANSGQLSQAHMQALVASMVQGHTNTPSTTTASKSSTSSSEKQSKSKSTEEALNLAKKDNISSSKTVTESEKAKIDESKKTGALSKCNFEELLQLANRSSDSRASVINMETGERWTDDRCPKIKHLEEWLTTHPTFELDLDGKKEKEYKEKNKSKAKNDEPPKLKIMSEEKNENTVITVFHKLTTQTVSSDKCPTLKNLASWLDKHPDYNIASKHSSLVKTILPRMYHDRIGGEIEAAQNLEQLMQLQAQAAQLQAVQSAQMMNPMMALYSQYAAMMAGGCTQEQQQQLMLMAQMQASLGAQAAAVSSASMMPNTSSSSGSSKHSSSKKESSNSSSRKQSTPKPSVASTSTNVNDSAEALLFQQLMSDPSIASMFAAANNASLAEVQQYLQMQQQYAALQAIGAIASSSNTGSSNSKQSSSSKSTSSNKKNSLDDQLNALINGTPNPKPSNTLASLAVSLSTNDTTSKDNSKSSTPTTKPGTPSSESIIKKVKSNKLSAVLDKLNSSKD